MNIFLTVSFDSGQFLVEGSKASELSHEHLGRDARLQAANVQTSVLLRPAHADSPAAELYALWRGRSHFRREVERNDTTGDDLLRVGDKTRRHCRPSKGATIACNLYNSYGSHNIYYNVSPCEINKQYSGTVRINLCSFP